jgi:staphyloferrin B biosynthesis citrate synthase
VLRQELLLGTFIKTPTTHPTEILAVAGLDFVIIDQEHGPFDRASTERALLAARAGGIPALVRVASIEGSGILAVLDDGATGVLVPHVANVDIASSVVRASRYGGGRRGFSNTTRAGRFGAASMWDHVHASDAETVVLAAIESPEALEYVDEIAAVDGLDGFFIGRGDLTVALGAESAYASSVRWASERIAKAALAKGKPVCAHVGSLGDHEFAWLRSIGVSVFVLSSDQGLLRHAAETAVTEFKALAAEARSSSWTVIAQYAPPPRG